MTRLLNFASENYAGVQKDMMSAIAEANNGHVGSYGNDPVTADAITVMKQHFGEDIDVYFAFNGTGANNFGLSSATKRYDAIYCTEVAHIYVDESTAPEAFTGCRIYIVKSKDGKIDPEALKNSLGRKGDVHHPQPGVVSITQPTEYGTVYTLEEIKTLKELCTENGMLLHVDGARFFNAVAKLNVSLKEMTEHMDILTLGGTKAGMMFGEAVIFFNQKMSGQFRFQLKRSMQLASKNRFISVQFKRMLQDNLWLDLAIYTNQLAKQFEREIAAVPAIKIAYPVETNAVFISLTKALYEKVQQHARFYYWNDEREEARLIFAFNNTPEEVTELVQVLKQLT
jgi:threonine aldolase